MGPFIFLAALIFACFTWTVAQSKGHEAGWWFFGGLLFGPLALLASIGLPDLKLRKYIRLLAEHQGAMDTEAPS